MVKKKTTAVLVLNWFFRSISGCGELDECCERNMDELVSLNEASM